MAPDSAAGLRAWRELVHQPPRVPAGWTVMRQTRATESSRARHGARGCADGFHRLQHGAYPSGGYSYYLDDRGQPRVRGGARGNVVRAVVAAHRTWDDVVNRCGLAHGVAFKARYRGLTRRSAYNRHDRVSVVGWGRPSAWGYPCDAANVIACTWFVTDSHGVATESDTLLRRSNGIWSALPGSTPAGVYDLRGMLTHEAGLAIGIAETGDRAHRWLTQFDTEFAGDGRLRTLALGDVLALREKYP
jgi:hypothetical protein